MVICNCLLELGLSAKKRNFMAKPTYQELQRRVDELENMVNIKISPQEFYFDTRDLIYFKGYRDWSLDLYDRKIEDLTGYKLEDFLERKVKWLDIVYEKDEEIARPENHTNWQRSRSYVTDA